MITVIVEEIRRWLLELAILYAFAVLLTLTAISIAAWFTRIFIRLHGPRTVVCPETGTAAVIEIDALHAAVGSMMGDPEIRLLSCSRWTERGECDQPCAKQLKP